MGETGDSYLANISTQHRSDPVRVESLSNQSLCQGPAQGQSWGVFGDMGHNPTHLSLLPPWESRHVTEIQVPLEPLSPCRGGTWDWPHLCKKAQVLRPHTAHKHCVVPQEAPGIDCSLSLFS